MKICSVCRKVEIREKQPICTRCLLESLRMGGALLIGICMACILTVLLFFGTADAKLKNHIQIDPRTAKGRVVECPKEMEQGTCVYIKGDMYYFPFRDLEVGRIVDVWAYYMLKD